MNTKQEIDIPISVFIKFLIIVAVFVLLYFIRDILFMVFTSLILAVALDQPIDKLQQRKIPRTLSALFIYAVLFCAVGLTFYLIFPPLVSEIKSFFMNYSYYLDYAIKSLQRPGWINFGGLIQNLPEKLAGTAPPIFSTIIEIFGGFLSFLVIIFTALFFNIQEKGVKKFVYYLTPEKNRDYIFGLFERIQVKMSAWLWGRLIIAVVIGILTSLGLYLFGIKYALTLGVLAAIFNFLPYIGAIISAIPAVFLGLIESPLLGLGVLVLYLFINSIVETFFLSPFLMKKVTGLNPAFLILVVLIGAKLAGILGIILAVPVALIVSILVEEYFSRKKLAD